MVQERRRLRAAQQSRQLNLTAGRCEQIDAADHQVHSLDVIVHGRGELIGPVAVAIAREQIAALLGRPLLL